MTRVITTGRRKTVAGNNVGLIIAKGYYCILLPGLENWLSNLAVLPSFPYNTPIFYLHSIFILISVDLSFPTELPLGHLSLFYLCRNNPKCRKWSLPLTGLNITTTTELLFRCCFLMGCNSSGVQPVKMLQSSVDVTRPPTPSLLIAAFLTAPCHTFNKCMRRCHMRSI